MSGMEWLSIMILMDMTVSSSSDIISSCVAGGLEAQVVAAVHLDVDVGDDADRQLGYVVQP